GAVPLPSAGGSAAVRSSQCPLGRLSASPARPPIFLGAGPRLRPSGAAVQHPRGFRRAPPTNARAAPAARCASALALGLPLPSSHSWFRPLAEHGLDARQVALGLAHLHRVGELGGRPLEPQVKDLVGELVLARAPPDVDHVPCFLRLHVGAHAWLASWGG